MTSRLRLQHSVRLQHSLRLSAVLAANGAAIRLSNASFTHGSAQGTAIGTLSVAGGTGSYTFTLTNNASNQAQISGTGLQAGSASASAGSFSVTVQATNGAGSTINKSLLITAT